MMRTKRLWAVILVMSVTGSLQAQNKIEGSLKADFVSSYVWRGLHLRHVSLQPELSVGWKGLSLAAYITTDSFSLPLFGQLVANPASQDFFFVAGFTLNAF